MQGGRKNIPQKGNTVWEGPVESKQKEAEGQCCWNAKVEVELGMEGVWEGGQRAMSSCGAS